MTHLDEIEDRAIHILREAYKNFNNLYMLWSIGKDSSVLLWLARKAFFGHVPFPLVFLDTSYNIPGMLEFRDKLAAEWNLKIINRQNREALDAGMNHTQGRPTCCGALLIQNLKRTIKDLKVEGLIVGVRGDEEGTRAKERYFSPRDENADWDFRDQPPELWDQYKTKFRPGTHVRIHPLLDWSEVNIWEYIEREGIPMCDLYYDQGEGKRFRSLGCAPCTDAILSRAANNLEIIEELKHTTVAERAGRAQDKEGRGLEALRKDGYM